MSINDSLLAGGRAPGLSFPTVGTQFQGVVVAAEEIQQRDIADGSPLEWPDGNPKMQFAITLQTDERDPSVPSDDGQRTLYVKIPSQLRTELARAVRASGGSFDTGGRLTVAYTGDGEPSKKGFTAPKIFAVTYTAGSQTKSAAASLLDEEPF